MIKGISETIKYEAKEQKQGFLNMLLDVLGATILVNLFTGKITITTARIFNAASYFNKFWQFT